MQNLDFARIGQRIREVRTLSRQLSQLEEEIGVKLFCRGARKITLTNEGILLGRRAEEILALVDRTEQELACQDGGND